VDAWDFEGDWRRFERSLKSENRYFNRTAGAILTSIFEGIDGHSTISGRPIVVEAGPGMELAVLYRARVFQREAKLKEAMKRPDMGLGPPPHRMQSRAHECWWYRRVLRGHSSQGRSS